MLFFSPKKIRKRKNDRSFQRTNDRKPQQKKKTVSQLQTNQSGTSLLLQAHFTSVSSTD